MLDHRGFSAWITSDELELVEFEPRVNEKAHTVTCWIAGPVGKTFIVHWRDHGSHVDSASYIHFDGFKVSGQFLYGKGEELRRGVRVSSEEERPFVFSSIEACDPSGATGNPADKSVGSIVLEIRLIKRVGEREPNPLRTPPNVVRGRRQEGDVCIRYGDIRPTATQKRTWVMEPFDLKSPGPYVTFVFRYRSQDWLVSQGIVNDEDEASRVPNHPPVKALSKADLPPIVASDDEEGDVLDSTPMPLQARSPPRPPRSPPAPFASARSTPAPRANTRSPSVPIGGVPSGLQALGRGPRPHVLTDAIRVPSNSSNRSFSGTWDPSASAGEYEEWDEYRPDDLNDAIENYY